MSLHRRVPVVVAALLASGLLLSPGVRGAGTEKSGGGITNVQGGPSTFTATNSSQVVKVTQFGTGRGVSATTVNGIALRGQSNSGTGVYGLGGNFGTGVRGRSDYGTAVDGRSTVGIGVIGGSTYYLG